MRRPEVIDHPDLCGRTALMWAAAKCSGDIIRAMCRHGAELGHQDRNGDTALHVAVSEDQFDAVLTLIRLGKTFIESHMVHEA